MAKITAAEVNKLRKATGAGMMDCKKALVEVDGDFDKAIEVLRKKGCGLRQLNRARTRMNMKLLLSIPIDSND